MLALVAAGAAAPPRFTHWIDGTDAAEPVTQVQAIDRDTYVIRQSVRTNFEAPFLYLLFGQKRALLLDSGAGGLTLRPTIDRLIDDWARAHHRAAPPLIVAHSHAHGDHVAGDGEFAGRPDTVVVGRAPAEVAAFFGVADWPRTSGSIDLGGRVLTAIPTPGHQPAHIMLYDPRDRLLLSGDALYPGRLYVPVNRMDEGRDSARRVAAFAATHPIRAVLGAHIEMTDAPGRDYPRRAATHPAEHGLALPASAIAEWARGFDDPPRVPDAPQIHDDFLLYPTKPS